MNASSAKISVITPAYNAEKYIGETIKSLQAQSFRDYEHIIVDDGSTDQTATTIEEQASKDARIRFITQKNSGPAAARNRALAEASGEFMIFVDADDTLAEETLKKLYHRADSTKADIIYYNFVRFFDQNESNWLKNHIDLDETKVYTKSQLSKQIFNVLPILTAGKLIKSSVLKKNKIEFNPSYRRDEDVDFSVRLVLLAKTFAYVDYYGYFYRVNVPDSETATNYSHPTQLLQILVDLNELIVQGHSSIKQSFDNYAAEQIFGSIIRQEDHPEAHKQVFDYASKIAIPKLALKKVDRTYIYSLELFEYLQLVAEADYVGTMLIRTKMLETRVNDLDITTRVLQKRLGELQENNARINSELDGVYSSLSWRLSRPLRILGRVKKVFGEKKG